MEFIQAFPVKAHDLAKEIAAFATSNAGTILLGVNDEGDCVGLAELVTTPQRDALLRRIEGICNGVVTPAITPIAKFAQEGGRTVVVLSVPKGSQPIYYSNGKPYLRHLTQSRPAQPHEVIELVRKATAPTAEGGAPIDETANRRILFLADLMRNLVMIRIFGQEREERMINPWLDLWRAQFADVAAQLREMAANKSAVADGLQESLLDTSRALDKVAKLRLHLNVGPQLNQLSEQAIAKVEDVLARIAPEVVAHVSPDQLVEQLQRLGRQLAILAGQADEASISGGLENFQARASELGSTILFTAQYGVERLHPGLYESLTNIGRKLHLIETERIYLDGGQSVDRIVNNAKVEIAAYQNAIRSLVSV